MTGRSYTTAAGTHRIAGILTHHLVRGINLIQLALTNTPWLFVHWKYLLPINIPSFSPTWKKTTEIYRYLRFHHLCISNIKYLNCFFKRVHHVYCQQNDINSSILKYITTLYCHLLILQISDVINRYRETYRTSMKIWESNLLKKHGIMWI